jgi:hypothetical protein
MLGCSFFLVQLFLSRKKKVRGKGFEPIAAFFSLRSKNPGEKGDFA